MSGYTLYAATAAGVFQSANAATSWVRSGPESLWATHLALGGRAELLAVGTREEKGFLGGKRLVNGLFVSHDWGASWRDTELVDRYNRDTGLQHVATGALAAVRGRLSLAGSHCGVWASDDGGCHWIPIGPGMATGSYRIGKYHGWTYPTHHVTAIAVDFSRSVVFAHGKVDHLRGKRASKS